LVEVKVQGGEPLLFTDAGEASREAWARHGSTAKIRVSVDSGRGRQRLWSIRDSQILYYVEHFAEARTLKQAAIALFLRDEG
jgi:hypothetical protein